MRTVTFILMTLMLSAILKVSQTVAQESRKDTSDLAAKSRLLAVTFRIECLRHDEAHALCEKHFRRELPEDIDLENCYTLKVDYQTVAHVGSYYDWLSQACLVDENGQLVKPLTWLEFLPGIDETEKYGSGLLIFPKIPLTGLGLTLRLLRANGDGYDSFTADVPQP